MIIEIFDKLVPTISVKARDAQSNEVYAEYSYPGDYQIIYAQAKFYLEFEPASPLSILEITTPLGTTDMQVSARVEDAAQASNNYLVDWSVALSSHWINYSNLSYMLYLKERGVEPVMVPYTEVDMTVAHVDFSNFDITTSTFPDTNSNPYFVATDAMPNSVGGFVADDIYCLIDPSGHIDAAVSYTTEGGFSFGCLYQKYITIDMGAIKITITEECELTFTATDGFRTVTVTESFTPTGCWRSLLVTMDGPVVRIYFRDMLIKSLLLVEDGVGLQNLDLSIHTITITAHAVDEFFIEQDVIDYVRATDFWISNKPVLIGTTRATQYMFPTSLFDGAPADYQIMIKGHSFRTDNVYQGLMEFSEIPIVTGKWCYVWDSLDIEFVSEYGISFEVLWNDMHKKMHYPKRRVPISRDGYFGIYLPVGDIITTVFYDTDRTFRFAVPDLSSSRMTLIEGGKYVLEY